MAISGPAPHRSTPTTRRLAGLAVAGLLGLGAVGCGAQEGAAQTAAETAAETGPETAAPQEQVEPGDGPRLVQGGEPGEAAREVPSDTTLPDNEWSQDDATYMTMMIPHHAQALEMTDLAAEHASDPRVKRLAERIAASQAPEIQVMAAWLDQRGLDVPTADDADHAGHGDHGAHMEGMLSEEQMAELAAARGAAFDRLFLTSMIRHHEGALAMASDTAVGGLDILVNEHRDGLTSDQSVEVARMQQLLDTL